MADNTRVLGQDEIQKPEVTSFITTDTAGKKSIDFDALSKIAGSPNPDAGYSGYNPQTRTTELPTGEREYRRRLGPLAPVEGIDPYEELAASQSVGERLGYMPIRALSKAVNEGLKLPGTIAAIWDWGTKYGFSEEGLPDAFNNGWNAMFTSLDESIKEKLPVYTPKSVAEGNIWQNLGSASFWANEGADGVGFFLGMLVPGAVVKAVGLGTKVANLPKLFKPGFQASQKLAGRIDDWTSVALNTGYEAGMEAMETWKEYLNEHPEDIDGASNAAARVFRGNAAILVGPNILTQKWVFNGFNRARIQGQAGKGLQSPISKPGLTDATKTSAAARLTDQAGNVVETIQPLSRLDKTLRTAKGLAKGIASEGFFEEGMQFTIAETAKQKALKGDTGSWVASAPSDFMDVIETYVETIVGEEDTDFWKSVVLGSLLGGGMSMFHTVKQNQQEETMLTNYHKLLRENYVSRGRTLLDFAKRDGTGKIIFDDKGNYEIDSQKLKEGGIQAYASLMEKELLLALQQMGDREGFETLKDKKDFDYMLPWLMLEGGYEVLRDIHLPAMARMDAKSLSQDTTLTEEKVAELVKEQTNELQKKLEAYKPIVDEILDKHNINFNLNYDRADAEEFNKFSQFIMQNKMAIKSQVNFIEGRIQLLRDQLSKLGINSSVKSLDETLINDLKEQYKERNSEKEFDKADKQLIDNAIENISLHSDNHSKAKEKLAKLYDLKLQQEEFNKRLIEKKKSDEEAKNAKNESEQSNKFASPELAAIYAENVKVEEVDVNGKPYKLHHRGQLKLNVERTNDEGKTEKKSIIFQVGDGNNSGNLNLYEIDKTGKTAGKASYLNADGTLVQGGVTWKVTNKTPHKTSDEVRLESRKLAILENIKDVHNIYDPLLGRKATATREKIEGSIDQEIRANIARIKDLQDRLTQAMEEHGRDLKTQRGTDKKIYVGTKKEGDKIKRITLTAVEIRNEIESLRERNQKLINKKQVLRERRDTILQQLKEAKQEPGHFLEFLNDLIEDLKTEEGYTQDMIDMVKDAIEAATAYVNNAMRVVKGYNTQIGRLLGLDLSDETLGIQDLPFAQREEVKNNMILDALSMEMSENRNFGDFLNRLLIEQNADQVKGLLANKEHLANKIVEHEQILEEHNESAKKYDKLHLEIGKTIALRSKQRNKFLAKYVQVVGEKNATVSDVVERDVIDNITPEGVMADIFERELARIRNSWETGARHVFDKNGEWTSFLNTISNQDMAGTNEDVARYFVFVNQHAHRTMGEKKEDKESRYKFRTVVYDQVKDLPDYIKDRLKFWIPEKNNADPRAGSFMSYNEIVQAKNQKGDTYPEEQAKKDIKVVATNYKGEFLRVSEHGALTGDNRQDIVFTSLPVASLTYMSGGPRFSYLELEAQILRDLKEKGEVYDSKEKAQEAVEKEKKIILDEALAKYEKFRQDLYTDYAVLEIEGVNPGVKEGAEILNTELEKAITQPVKSLYFKIESAKHAEDLNPDKPKTHTMYASGTKYDGRTGFLYVLINNRWELVKPKTLEETGSVEDIVNLLRYIAKQEGDYAQAYAFMKTILYNNYENLDYRFFFEHKIHTKKAKKEGDTPLQLKTLVFGEQELNLEDLIEGRNLDGLREFLKTKYWNFNKKLLEGNADFTSFHVDKSLNATSTNWEIADGGYKAFLFESKSTKTLKGGNKSKGVVNVKAAPQGKNKAYLLAKEPQYANQSLRLGLLGTRAVDERAVANEQQETPKPKARGKRMRFVAYDISKDASTGKYFIWDGNEVLLVDENLKGKDVLSAKSAIPITGEGGLADVLTVAGALGRGKKGNKIKQKFLLADGETTVDMILEIDEVFEPPVEPEVIEPSSTVEVKGSTSIKVEPSSTVVAPVPTAQEITDYFNALPEATQRMYKEQAEDNNASSVEEFAWSQRPDPGNFDRVATELIDYRLEDLEKAKAWFRQRFPDLPLEIVEGLIDNVSWGRLVGSSKVLLSDIAAEGTVYHEAFHAWHRLFNTPEQRQELYNHIRKTVDSTLTDAQAEEILADEFKDYMLQSGNYTFRKGENVKKNLFQRLWDALKSLYNKLFGIDIATASARELADVFKKIENGEFTQMNVIQTESNEIWDKIAGLSPEESSAYVQNINFEFFAAIMRNLKTGGDLIFNAAKHKDGIYGLLKSTIYPTHLKDPKLTKAARQSYEKILSNWDALTKAHGIFLTQYSIDVREELDEENMLHRDNRDHLDSSRKPIAATLPSPIKLLIGGLPSITMNRGSIKGFSKFGIYNTVQYNKILNTINRHMAKVTSLEELTSKLNNLAKSSKYREFEILIKRLGLDKPADSLSDSQLKLIGQFYSAFANHQNKPYVIVRRHDGLMLYSDPISKTDTNVLKNEWVTNAIRNSSKSPYIRHERGNYYVNTGVLSNDLIKVRETLNARRPGWREAVNGFLNDLGISITDDVNNINSSGARIIGKYFKFLGQELDALKHQGRTEIDINELYDAEIMQNQAEMNDLLVYAAGLTVNDMDLMYFNQDGNMEWSITKNSHVTQITNRLNNFADTKQYTRDIAHLKPYTGVANNDHFGNLYTLNSKWLRILETSTGEFPAEIRHSVIRGINSDTRDNAINSATNHDYKAVVFESVLRNMIPTLRSGNRSMEHALQIQDTNYGVTKETFKKDMMSYLYDEVITSIALNLAIANKVNLYGVNHVNYSKNARSLRVFSFLYDTKYKNNPLSIEDFVSGVSNTIELDATHTPRNLEILKNLTEEYLENNATPISTILNNKIDEMIRLNKESLADSKIIIPAENKKWQMPGLSFETLKDANKFGIPMVGNTITDAQMDRVALVATYNYFVASQEQLKLYFGDPATYASPLDFHKRLSSSTSTKNQTLNDPAILNALDTNNNGKFRRIDKKRQLTIKTRTVPTITAETVDHNVSEELKAISSKYNPSKIKIADGQAMGTLDFIMDLGTRDGTLTLGQEKAYQYEMQSLALHVIKNPTKYKTSLFNRAMFEDEVTGVFYRHTNGVVPTKPMFNGKEINPYTDNLEPITALKTQGAGSYQDNSGISSLDIQKMSVDPILPSVLIALKNTDHIQLLLDLYEDGVDVYGDFEMHKSDRILGDSEILYDDYGIQQDVHTEFKDRVTYSTQLGRLLFLDAYSEGALLEEYADLHGLNLEYTDLMSELYSSSIEKLVDELGLELSGDRYILAGEKNIDKFRTKLQKLFIQRLIPQNAIDGLDIVLDSSQKIFDVLINNNKIKEILYSIVRNNTIKRKVKGEAFVQASNFIYSADLKFYRVEKGKVLPMEVMVPIPEAWLEWVDEIGGIDVLNDIVAKGQLDERLLTMTANRIPSAFHNTLEAIKIKRFLPFHAGAKIVLPYEIVVKAGSDFDIDKLTTYLNSFATGKGAPVYIEYLTDVNSGVADRYQIKHGKYRKMLNFFDNKADNEFQKFTDRASRNTKPFLQAIDNLFKGLQITEKLSLDYWSDQEIIEMLDEFGYNINYEKLKELAKLEEDTAPTLEDFKRLPIQAQNTRKAIENRINEISQEALLHPKRFKNLVTPNETSYLEKVSLDNHIPHGMSETLDQATYDSITQMWYNIIKANIFWESDMGISTVALNVANHATSQYKPVRTNNIIQLFFKGQESSNGYTNGILENESGKTVSNILNELVSSYVDAEKNPFIVKMIAAKELLPIAIFLTRFGKDKSLDINNTAAFLNNPIIKDYIKEFKISVASSYAQNNQYSKDREWFNRNFGWKASIIDKILKANGHNVGPKSYDTTLAAAMEGYFSTTNPKVREHFAKKIEQRLTLYNYKHLTLKDLQKPTAETKAQILDNFLMYQYFGGRMSGLNSVTRPDAKFGKSSTDIALEMARLDSLLKSGFFNAEDVMAQINETFLSGAQDIRPKALQMLKNFWLIDSWDYLTDWFNANFIDHYANYRQQGSQEDTEKAMTTIYNKFISFLFTSQYPTKEARAKRLEELYMGKDSIANRLIGMKTALKDNPIIDALKGVINEYGAEVHRKRGFDYVTKFEKRFTVDDINTFVDAFEELSLDPRPEVQEFAADLMELAFLQSGLNASPINFYNLVPNNVFANRLLKVFDAGTSEISDDIMRSFKTQLYRNSWNDSKIVPRRKYPKYEMEKEIIVNQSSREANNEFLAVTYFSEDKVTHRAGKKYNIRGAREILLYQKTDKTDVEFYKGRKDKRKNPQPAFVYKLVGKLGDGMRMDEFYFVDSKSAEGIKSVLQANNYDFEGLEQNIEVKDKKQDPKLARTVQPVIQTAKTKYSRDSVRKDRNTLYIFTDNTDRTSGTNPNVEGWYAKQYGEGLSFGTINNPTTAVIRGLENAYPISTMKWFYKKHNTTVENSRWQDKDFDTFKEVIDSEMDQIKTAISSGKYTKIIIPSGDGFFNSKIANISQTRTPKLYGYLKSKIEELTNNVNAEVKNTQPNNKYGLVDEAFQLSRDADNREALEELNNSMMDFLTSAGVTINKTEVIRNRFGEEVPMAIALAKLSEMTLDVVEGRMNATTLPEEAAHFYIALLDKNSTFYKSMYDSIENYAEYTKVKEEYKDRYKSDAEFREEAIGKVIANKILSIHDSALSDRQDRQVTSWWSKLWNYIKSIFSKVNTDPYVKAAHDILSNNLAEITLKSENMQFEEPMTRLYRSEDDTSNDKSAPEWVKESREYKQSEEVKGRWFYSSLEEAQAHANKFGSSGITYVDIPTSKLELFNAKDNKFAGGYGRQGNEYFISREYAETREMYQLGSELFAEEDTKPIKQKWDELPATPKGNMKFLYTLSERETNTTYNNLVEDFGEDMVTVIPVKYDNKYHSKIAVRSPRESANEAAFQADDTAQQNIREFAKEPFPVDQDLFMANFDLYYPDYAHKDISEKQAFIEALTMGEIEQICGI